MGEQDGGVQVDDGVELKVTDGRVYRCQLCADAMPVLKGL